MIIYAYKITCMYIYNTHTDTNKQGDAPNPVM